MNLGRATAPLVLAVGMAATPAMAATTTLDFEEFVHGEIITISKGVVISTINGGAGPDLVIAFDSRETGTSDIDLEDPFDPPRGAVVPGISAPPTAPDGNIRPGNIAIVQENTTGCGDGICNDPDDEGSGPNVMMFDWGPNFANGVELVELDIYDLDQTDADPGQPAETLDIELIYTDGTSDTASFSGDDFGDRAAGRIDLSAFFGRTTGVSKANLDFSHGGAVSNITFKPPNGGSIPEPGSMGLLLTGLLGLEWARRRRAARKAV